MEKTNLEVVESATQTVIKNLLLQAIVKLYESHYGANLPDTTGK